MFAFTAVRSPFIFPSLTRRSAGMPQLGTFDDDLLTVAAWQRIVLAALPLLTLAAFGALYAHGAYLALPVVMLMHFVVTVAYLHDVAHGSAGLDPRVTHVVLFIVSVLVLQSGHSFRYTHLHHHAHCLEDNDLEGAPARASLLGALLAGPLYLPRLWRESLRKIRPARERRWMVAELAASLALVLLALWLTRRTTGAAGVLRHGLDRRLVLSAGDGVPAALQTGQQAAGTGAHHARRDRAGAWRAGSIRTLRRRGCVRPGCTE